MSAAVTLTGTITTLPIDAVQNAGLNVPSVNKLDFEDLKAVEGTIFPELRDFIQACATAWGIQFWPAAAIVEVLFRALMNSQGPTQMSTYTP